MFGQKFFDKIEARMIEQCCARILDTAVCSVQLAKNGCNLQGMNWMVSLDYIGRYIDKVQCKGNYGPHDGIDLQVECAELAKLGL